MKELKIAIGGIPAIVWGEPSEKIYIHVHGKMSCKEYARAFAEIMVSYVASKKRFGHSENFCN